jgi:hypothetical protein
MELTGEVAGGYVGGLRWSSDGPMWLRSGGRGAAKIGEPGGVPDVGFAFLLRRLRANGGGER